MSESVKDRGVVAKSSRLKGMRVGFAICGGIGAVEVVKLIRELRRHGAVITPFASPSMTRFITPLSVEWAAAAPLLTEAQAEVDHLEHFDLVVVAPATLNTINKAALGLTDNAVTLVIASQLGRKAPVMFCPTMNEAMQKHPSYENSKQQLQSWGALFLEPVAEEGRFKMPTRETLLTAVVELLNPENPLK